MDPDTAAAQNPFMATSPTMDPAAAPAQLNPAMADPASAAMPQQPTSQQPAKKPKLNRTTILIIVLAAIVLIGGIVLAIILISTSSTPSSRQASNQYNDSPYDTGSDPDTPIATASNLQCVTTSNDAALLESLGQPSSYQSEIKASFDADGFSSISQIYTAQYASVEAAAQGLSILQNQYNTYIAETVGLSADPMVSNYTISDNAAVSSHTVDKSALNMDSARALGFNVDAISNISELNLSYDNLQSAYASQGFICQSVGAVE